jgi:tryptophanyl-tRNA synthetase
MSKPIFLTGVQPTGRPHLGNYFGTMKQLVDGQGQYDVRAVIVDLHALTTVQDAETLSEYTLDLAIDYLAIGLDPKEVLIFKQSDMPEVTEMAWVFNCITTVPYLSQAHAYKDKVAKGKEASVGLFTYPILMAADILIHNANIVPVGRDQKQHVEMARDIAEKCNRIYCTEKGKPELFTLPEPMILEDVEVIPGIDGQKMSKSYNNHIPLFATDEEIRKLVMAIVTDSGNPADIASGAISGIPEHVYNIHKLVRDQKLLDELYEANRGKYKILKEALIEDLIAFIGPMREKREKIAEDIESVKKLLADNAVRVRDLTKPLMEEFRKVVGLR